MLLPKVVVPLAFALLVTSQTTYTGCHNHSSVEFCYGPDGEETARATYSIAETITAPATNDPSTTTSGQTMAITGCHMHDTEVVCINGNEEEVFVEATVTGEPPAQYTDCHSHGEEQFCLGPDGEDVLILAEEHSTPSTTASGQTTAITGCHMYDTEVVCINGNDQEVVVEATVTGEPPAQYTDCHSHGEEQFCLGPEGEEVLVLAEEHSDAHEDHDHTDEAEAQGENCHFHAGVEHCVAAGESESSTSSSLSCDVRTREYNIPVRVGTLFAILVTSSIGVFGPIFLNQMPLGAVSGIVLSMLKQFGTGVIISTAFVHLYTHAYLMFTNECLGALSYEATTSAVVMAGVFLAFLIEYGSHRIVLARSRNSNKGSQEPSTESATTPEKTQQSALATFADHHLPSSSLSANTYLNVLVMEAGIIFHSVLIGLTLVVAADSYYITLFIVIVFHQFFEGVALGSRIAVLSGSRHPLMSKLLMATAFALITPLGMAIGLGVLNRFNGNDPSTIVAIGTLDALSAGILLWVGVVDMWARDWVMEGGELVDAGVGKVFRAGLSLVSGLVLMGVLGKWA